MRLKIQSLIMISLIMILSITAGGTLGAITSEVQYYDMSSDDLVNQTVIADYYSSDSRTDDYMLETFDDSSLDFFDGLKCPWKSNSNYHSCVHYTTQQGEYFGSSAIYFNSTDGEIYYSSHSIPIAYYTNSTSNVRTLEFDWMVERDSEPIEIGINFEPYVISINSSDMINWSVAQTFTAPNIAQDIGFNITPGKWVHTIISLVDNIVDGFELTVFLGNASVVFHGDRIGLSAGFRKLYLTWDSGESYGRDLVVDNVAMYNGSFNHSEIYAAIFRTYISETISSYLPVVIMLSFVGMMIAMFRKFAA